MANSSAVSRAMRSSGSAAADQLCEFCEGAASLDVGGSMSR